MKPVRNFDDKLMKEFNRGARQALSQVYDMWFSDLCHFAYRVTRNMSEAEDITVTTLQVLLSRHEHFETMDNVKAFLYISVKNRCLNFLQQAEKRKAVHQFAHELQGEAKEDHLYSEMVMTELLQQIQNEIETLPPKRKEVFKLYYVEGLNVSEIAEKLQMTPNAVSTTKFRALEQLRTVVTRLSPVAGILSFIQQLFL